MDKNTKKTPPALITRDWLAIERTKLANERTFLAYFRTFMVFLGTGLTIIKMHMFVRMEWFGVLLLIIAPIVLAIGVYRLIKVRNIIRDHYNV
ncbi:DUF202 domain-containing protein [Formosa sp. L2A11]|uniref:DUF202 domain-containing protein n=1 Tax=Formosa sp. L2A11 TaxID=2686363 RepID=UPI00131D5189|nr:DUF202 domain-containing protein [Formosa sp. L2A11]